MQRRNEVSSAGTPLAPKQMASPRTIATVHDDGATAQWFYPAFREQVTSRPKAVRAMADTLVAQDRVVIESGPQSWNTFDVVRMRG